MNKLKELTRNNIRTALDDYFCHADSDDVYENISEEFVERLANDSINSKHALRELFCQSQGWNENLQAIAINGTKTHNPDYTLVHDLAHSILYPAKLDADYDKLTSPVLTTNQTTTSTQSISSRLKLMLRAKNAVGFSKPFAIRSASLI